jgi:hypothetical protein
MKNITKTHLSNRAISRRFVRAIEMIAKASINLPARNNHDHIITRVVSLSPSEITAACCSDDEKGENGYQTDTVQLPPK